MNVWRIIDKMCDAGNLVCPSPETVRQRINKLGPKKLLKRQRGKDISDDKFSPRPGFLKVARPLQFVEIDHTLVDIILVDEAQRLPIGRPWVTIVIDTYTRVILGFYLSLSPPSRYSVACAISHASLPKFEWLKSIGGEDIPYPFYGVPEEIHVDNASEFHSADFKLACDSNNIELQWRVAKHYGGRVERLIGTMMTQYVHFLPGTTMSNPHQRGTYDSDANAVYTFREFREIFTREICKYHQARHSALNTSPTEKWSEYFQDSNGSIIHPAIVSDPRTFKIDFMPSEIRTMHNYGMEFSCLMYFSDSLVHRIGEKIKFKYCPDSLRKIYVLDSGRYIDIPYDDLRYPDINIEELRIVKKELKRLGRPATPKEIFRQQEIIEQRTEDARIKTKATRRLASKKSLQGEHQMQSSQPNKLDAVTKIRYSKNTPALKSYDE
jgi:putative transposase